MVNYQAYSTYLHRLVLTYACASALHGCCKHPYACHAMPTNLIMSPNPQALITRSNIQLCKVYLGTFTSSNIQRASTQSLAQVLKSTLTIRGEFPPGKVCKSLDKHLSAALVWFALRITTVGMSTILHDDHWILECLHHLSIRNEFTCHGVSCFVNPGWLKTGAFVHCRCSKQQHRGQGPAAR